MAMLAAQQPAQQRPRRPAARRGSDKIDDQFDASSLLCMFPDIPKSFSPTTTYDDALAAFSPKSSEGKSGVEVTKKKNQSSFSPKGSACDDTNSPSTPEEEKKAAPPLLTNATSASSADATTVTPITSRNSQNAVGHHNHNLHLFYPDEIIRGRVLGKGTFGCVYEVSQFAPLPEHDSNFTEESRKLRENYSYLARPAQFSKYAVKTLHDSFDDVQTERMAVDDIRHEVTLLQTLVHPHIIRMHAASASVTEGAAVSSKDCFIVLDRLTGTLDGKLSRWKSEKKKAKGPRKKQLLCQRLRVAVDVASALSHLHSRRMIYRDLKQDNVGFNVEGKCILFDFGLARELPPPTSTTPQPELVVAHEDHRRVEPRPPEVTPVIDEEPTNSDGSSRKDDGSSRKDDEKEQWLMSGRTGSLPFMSPEVYHRYPYNAKTDVYSMSIMLWVIVSAELPYMDLAHNIPNLTHRIMMEGYRPPLKENKWSGLLIKLLKQSWSTDPVQRPTMEEFGVKLKDVIKSESVPSVKARTIKRSFFM